MSYVEPLMRQHFLEYASYVIVDRAIPDLRDGCKPVQRRILHTLHRMDDGRFHKVANVIGSTMQLHPHGDASIGDALVVLANKEYFIERQGNFGNILTGHAAAAPRYIECRLTELARDTLFNPKLTEMQASYDDRNKEPVSLPAKLPVILMLGTEGIAVGMSTRIMPHNFTELLEAQVAILRKEKFSLLPDFRQGGVMDAAEYDDGRGKVRVRAKLEVAPDSKSIIVRDVPFGTTTEGLITSIETAAQKNKIKIGSIEDRTAENVEVVLTLPRGVYADEVVPQLWAYTNCEMSISSNITVINGDRPAEMAVSEMLEILTERLRDQIRQELELELDELGDKRHFMTLERIFIEEKVYKRLEKADTADSVRRQVWTGMKKFADDFVREMTEDDVDRLLKIQIRRISVFDIEKHRKDLDDILASIAAAEKKLKQLTRTTISYLTGLIKKYGKTYPRRTKVESFDVVTKKEVARQTLKVSYDPKSGFFGTTVKGEKFEMTVSEYDDLLIVRADGSYQISRPPEKLLVEPRPLHIQVLDEDGCILTVVYRDKKRVPWAKKVHIKAFIRDKEYELIKDRKGKIDKLKVGEDDRLVHIQYAPAPRQRVHESWFDLTELEFCGTAARGTKIGDKPASHVKLFARDD